MTKERTHLDLFSGIGGFALAARWNGVRTVGFCECDPYAQQVLKERFPGIPIVSDVNELLCELRNNNLSHCVISRLRDQTNCSGVSNAPASDAVRLNGSPQALPVDLEEKSTAHGVVGRQQCGEQKHRMQAVESGCSENPIRTGKTAWEMSDSSNTEVTKLENGEGAYSIGTATPASIVGNHPKEQANSMPTTSKLGQNFQSCDLKYLMELLYASHVTRGFTVDIITAGFPCQPFSVAGKRRGKEDDRYLWPSLCSIIEILRPPLLLLENVPGIITMELDRVLSDLEGIGYACRPIVIPACSVDAKHRRNRVWIVAHSRHGTQQNWTRGPRWEKRERPSIWGKSETGGTKETPASQSGNGSWARGPGESAADSDGINGNGVGFPSSEVAQFETPILRRSEYVTNTNGQPSNWTSISRGECRQWQPEPSVGRVAHGVPHRSHRLRGLGNAIVPQVAQEIIRMMILSEQAMAR